MPEIKPADLTPRHLVGLGVDHIDGRLPLHVLVAAARKYVALEEAKERRRRNQAAERRAHGSNPKIARRVAQVAAEAALEHEVVWADILDIPIGAGGEGQTWGSATADDHTFAAEVAEGVAAGHVQRAAMHRRAVADLAFTGAPNLADSTMGLK